MWAASTLSRATTCHGAGREGSRALRDSARFGGMGRGVRRVVDSRWGATPWPWLRYKWPAMPTSHPSAADRPRQPLVFDAGQQLNAPGRYEDRYGGFMGLFKSVAYASLDFDVTVENAPPTWRPLLHALGAQFSGAATIAFHEDRVIAESVASFVGAPLRARDRTALEAFCAMRPETVDALWKCDCQWRAPRTERGVFATSLRDFSVTCNGSFFRAEIFEYMDQLKHYVPRAPNLVLVPCAADKPYPSPLHQMVIDALPDDSWDIMNATGVLGLVPRDLWDFMPHYDSGIPNEWRLMHVAAWYFHKWRAHYKRIVCHTDYYSLSLLRAFQLLGWSVGTPPVPAQPSIQFTRPINFHYDYEDLMGRTALACLSASLTSDFSHVAGYHGLTDPVYYFFNEQRTRQ